MSGLKSGRFVHPGLKKGAIWFLGFYALTMVVLFVISFLVVLRCLPEGARVTASPVCEKLLDRVWNYQSTMAMSLLNFAAGAVYGFASGPTGASVRRARVGTPLRYYGEVVQADIDVSEQEARPTLPPPRSEEERRG